MSEIETKKCPFCAEDIKKEAIVCRFCGYDLKAGKPERREVMVTDTINKDTRHLVRSLLVIFGVVLLIGSFYSSSPSEPEDMGPSYDDILSRFGRKGDPLKDKDLAELWNSRYRNKEVLWKGKLLYAPERKGADWRFAIDMGAGSRMPDIEFLVSDGLLHGREFKRGDRVIFKGRLETPPDILFPGKLAGVSIL